MNKIETHGLERVLDQVRGLIELGEFAEALKVLAASGMSSPELQNAAGVCHLRAGRTEKALEVFRGLCTGDCVGVRPDASPVHLVNFATALLLTGNLSGCRHMLQHLNGSPLPAADRLRDAIAHWRGTLGWWRRLAFNAGLYEPRKPIQLGFPPGELP